ncbi:MAG TPA: 50S ribosomal protein L30 [Nanoarchaeota archaeon]|nr:50S ribosomal protein L30 [Nanoarchaeota archaeon]
MKRVAIIRIHGDSKLRHDVVKTFDLLRLYKKHTCIVVANNSTYSGMLHKIKDFATWGELKPEVFRKMIEKRGRLPGNKPLTEAYLKDKTGLGFDDFTKQFMEGKKELNDVPGLKHFFKLCPPVKGFERKGIKMPFSMGGVVGYRKEYINDLLERML